MKKFGKSIGNILNIKKSFFENNRYELEKRNKAAEILKLQKKRINCKICHKNLPINFLFQSHGLNYYLCENCGHLNSEYEENENFANQIYLEDNYEHNYTENDYLKFNERVNELYKPKADFLLDCLKSELSLSEINVLDIGAGSGYFVKSLINEGIRAFGVEISEKQVDFANKMSKSKILNHIDSNQLCQIIEKSTSNVLSAIGVLEHLINLDQVFESISKNSNINYFYFSVPLFSFSVIFEAANPDVFNRHLGGGHTHLFSDKSIEYIAKEIGFSIKDTWKFSSDIMDLYRTTCINLEKTGNKNIIQLFSQQFVPLIDKMQLIIDESEYASEIHVLMKRDKK